MDNLTEEVFRHNLNTPFTVLGGGADSVQLELIECKDLGSTPRQEQFSILFRGPLQPSLLQTTYEMKHEKLDEILIFIVPVKQDSEFTYYEAVFNRFIEPE